MLEVTLRQDGNAVPSRTRALQFGKCYALFEDGYVLENGLKGMTLGKNLLHILLAKGWTVHEITSIRVRLVRRESEPSCALITESVALRGAPPRE